MDKIVLNRMEFYGYHGVHPAENQLGQRYDVDLELNLDLEPAALADDISLTVNYAEVYETLKAIVEGKPYALIETVAEQIATVLLDSYTKLDSVMVRVIKLNPPFPIHFAGVSVEIHRGRPEKSE